MTGYAAAEVDAAVRWLTPTATAPPPTWQGLSSVEVACLAALLVACLLTTIELRRSASWSGMFTTGLSWTLAALGTDGLFAAVVALGVQSGITAVVPDTPPAAALVTGVLIGLSPVSVAALRMPLEARNRVADVRDFFKEQVELADARNQSEFVRKRLDEITDIVTVDDVADDAIEFLTARARQGKIHNADAMIDNIRATAQDRESDRLRLRSIITTLLDHEGRSVVNALRRKAKARRKAQNKGPQAATTQRTLRPDTSGGAGPGVSAPTVPGSDVEVEQERKS